MKRIIGYGLIGNMCDHRDCQTGRRCTATAASTFRHKATGSVVSARCRKHDTTTRRMELKSGRCPTCRLSRDEHHDEDANTYSCDTAINRAADMAERNLPA